MKKFNIICHECGSDEVDVYISYGGVDCIINFNCLNCNNNEEVEQ